MFSNKGREICLLQSDVGVPLADFLQVLGTPNSTPSFLSVQVSERTEGIVGLEIPGDEELGEVRLVLSCGSFKCCCQRTAWEVDICLVKHVVPKRLLFWPRLKRFRHML